jgi:hypothetical protein
MDKNVKQILQDIGVWEYLTPINRPLNISSRDGVVYLGIKSGFAVAREVADQLQQDLSKVFSIFQSELALNDGIVEAMQNVSDWAYSKITLNKRRWWLSAGYNSVTKTIHFMVCDHGLTIPRTLPISKFFQRFGLSTDLVRKLILTGDAQVIQKAMEVGKTASGLSHRGKGLRDMIDYITSKKQGTLRIISRYGDYTIDQNLNETVRNHPLPLGGTIIAWNIQLEDIESAQDG